GTILFLLETIGEAAVTDISQTKSYTSALVTKDAQNITIPWSEKLRVSLFQDSSDRDIMFYESETQHVTVNNQSAKTKSEIFRLDTIYDAENNQTYFKEIEYKKYDAGTGEGFNEETNGYPKVKESFASYIEGSRLKESVSTSKYQIDYNQTYLEDELIGAQDMIETTIMYNTYGTNDEGMYVTNSVSYGYVENKDRSLIQKAVLTKKHDVTEVKTETGKTENYTEDVYEFDRGYILSSDMEHISSFEVDVDGNISLNGDNIQNFLKGCAVEASIGSNLVKKAVTTSTDLKKDLNNRVLSYTKDFKEYLYDEDGFYHLNTDRTMKRLSTDYAGDREIAYVEQFTDNIKASYPDNYLGYDSSISNTQTIYERVEEYFFETKSKYKKYEINGEFSIAATMAYVNNFDISPKHSKLTFHEAKIQTDVTKDNFGQEIGHEEGIYEQYAKGISLVDFVTDIPVARISASSQDPRYTAIYNEEKYMTIRGNRDLPVGIVKSLSSDDENILYRILKEDQTFLGGNPPADMILYEAKEDGKNIKYTYSNYDILKKDFYGNVISNDRETISQIFGDDWVGSGIVRPKVGFLESETYEWMNNSPVYEINEGTFTDKNGNSVNYSDNNKFNYTRDYQKTATYDRFGNILTSTRYTRSPNGSWNCTERLQTDYAWVYAGWNFIYRPIYLREESYVGMRSPYTNKLEDDDEVDSDQAASSRALYLFDEQFASNPFTPEADLTGTEYYVPNPSDNPNDYDQNVNTTSYPYIVFLSSERTTIEKSEIAYYFDSHSRDFKELRWIDYTISAGGSSREYVGFWHYDPSLFNATHEGNWGDQTIEEVRQTSYSESQLRSDNYFEENGEDDGYILYDEQGNIVKMTKFATVEASNDLNEKTRRQEIMNFYNKYGYQIITISKEVGIYLVSYYYQTKNFEFDPEIYGVSGTDLDPLIYSDERVDGNNNYLIELDHLGRYDLEKSIPTHGRVRRRACYETELSGLETLKAYFNSLLTSVYADALFDVDGVFSSGPFWSEQNFNIETGEQYASVSGGMYGFIGQLWYYAQGAVVSIPATLLEIVQVLVNGIFSLLVGAISIARNAVRVLFDALDNILEYASEIPDWAMPDWVEDKIDEYREDLSNAQKYLDDLLGTWQDAIEGVMKAIENAIDQAKSWIDENAPWPFGGYLREARRSDLKAKFEGEKFQAAVDAIHKEMEHFARRGIVEEAIAFIVGVVIYVVLVVVIIVIAIVTIEEGVAPQVLTIVGVIGTLLISLALWAWAIIDWARTEGEWNLTGDLKTNKETGRLTKKDAGRLKVSLFFLRLGVASLEMLLQLLLFGFQIGNDPWQAIKGMLTFMLGWVEKIVGMPEGYLYDKISSIVEGEDIITGMGWGDWYVVLFVLLAIVYSPVIAIDKAKEDEEGASEARKRRIARAEREGWILNSKYMDQAKVAGEILGMKLLPAIKLL
ncbi:hypothetical protein KKC59_01425, partial [bacterium]|nr:hypothetical protein [bacterium]